MGALERPPAAPREFATEVGVHTVEVEHVSAHGENLGVAFSHGLLAHHASTARVLNVVFATRIIERCGALCRAQLGGDLLSEHDSGRCTQLGGDLLSEHDSGGYVWWEGVSSGVGGAVQPRVEWAGQSN